MRYALLILPVLLTGCGLAPRSSITGYIFENYHQPFTVNLDKTPVAWKAGSGKIVEVQEPFSGYGMSAEFSSNAVGDIARHYGIKRVFWADMEYFNVLGIWKEQRLTIYGEAFDPDDSPPD